MVINNVVICFARLDVTLKVDTHGSPSFDTNLSGSSIRSLNCATAHTCLVQNIFRPDGSAPFQVSQKR